MKPPGMYDELGPRSKQSQSRRNIRYIRRRYRGRIGCFAPETLVALSVFLLIIGASMLFTYQYCGLSKEDEETVFKLSTLMSLLGWVLITYIYETTKLRSRFRRDSQIFDVPPIVGVHLPAPIHQEWLSAQLLPRVNRGWVPGETLAGYEPYRGEFGQPPIRPEPIIHEEPQPPVSKKKRNRKNKNALNDQSGDSSVASNTADDLNMTSSQSEDSSMSFNLPEDSNMTFNLSEDLSMTSNKTLKSQGFNNTIHVQGTKNGDLPQGSNNTIQPQVSYNIIQPQDSNNIILPQGTNNTILPQGSNNTIRPQSSNNTIHSQGSNVAFMEHEGSNIVFNKSDDLNLVSNQPKKQTKVSVAYVSKSKKKRIRNKRRKLWKTIGNQSEDPNADAGQSTEDQGADQSEEDQGAGQSEEDQGAGQSEEDPVAEKSNDSNAATVGQDAKDLNVAPVVQATVEHPNAIAGQS